MSQPVESIEQPGFNVREFPSSETKKHQFCSSLGSAVKSTGQFTANQTTSAMQKKHLGLMTLVVPNEALSLL